jgi:hypothetical protein
VVKTAVGANSQATAAHGPPSRSSAAAATADAASETSTPVKATGMPRLSPNVRMADSPGKNAIKVPSGSPR